ncbi:nucleotide disphospho-sugar-binding domain-containing protein [Streptomyces sp. NPDC013178]|uniref:nucleotide disphospho-sugar-binding domain-containing protein n=1 Tax=Streptomyces sp. NPDC013178 TaxID=3155118 RepID=UPI0033D83032
MTGVRVLFTASDWRGHYYCTVPLAWALQAAGHDVRVACPPGQAESVSRAGLVAVPVLEAVDMTTMGRMFRYLETVAGTRPGLPLHPYTGEPVRSLKEFDVAAEAPRFQEQAHRAIARSYDGAVAFAERWRPELVVHDLTAPEGALAAQLTGCPSVYHPPGLHGTDETEPGVDLGDGDPSGSFPRYGRPRWHTGHIDYVVDPSPDVAVPPMGSALRLPVRYVPYNGPAVLPEWLLLERARPRLCVLVGASAAAEAADIPLLRAAIGAALDGGAEVVLTTTPAQATALGELPDGVRVLHDFPLRLLLEHGDAVVHHGSVNALMTAAASGVPQLSLSFTDEQGVVSRRIAATGAGVALSALRSDPAEVGRAAVRVLFGDGHREAAHRLRDIIAAQPAPTDLVAPLERLARHGRLTKTDLPRYQVH